jgi:hypothetical protein
MSIKVGSRVIIKEKYYVPSTMLNKVFRVVNASGESVVLAEEETMLYFMDGIQEIDFQCPRCCRGEVASNYEHEFDGDCLEVRCLGCGAHYTVERKEMHTYHINAERTVEGWAR